MILDLVVVMNVAVAMAVFRLLGWLFHDRRLRGARCTKRALFVVGPPARRYVIGRRTIT